MSLVRYSLVLIILLLAAYFLFALPYIHSYSITLCKQPHKRKVFGIGMSRTGTSSLSAALQHLNYNTWHGWHGPHSKEALLNYGERFDALVDFMGIADEDLVFHVVDEHFKDTLDALTNQYPDCVFILTYIKDTKKWLRSLNYLNRYRDLLRCVGQGALFTRFQTKRLLSDEILERAYESYKDKVEDYFKESPEKLLVFDVTEGDGWDKLCTFLSEPVPTNCPFPYKKPMAIYLEQLLRHCVP